MSTNNGAVNLVASGKRKFTDYQEAGSVNKKSMLPIHAEHHEHIGVSQSSCVEKQLASRKNFQNFSSSLNSGHYNANHDDNLVHINSQAPWEAKDPFDTLLKSQYQELRESCQKHFTNKYNHLLREAEDRASRILMEKDTEMGHMEDLMAGFKERVATLSTKIRNQHEVIKNKETELTTIKRKNVELEEKQAHYKSQAEGWKGKAERAEVVLRNLTESPQGHSAGPCDEEDTGSSFVGEKVVEGDGSCKVCGKGTATVMMWPCRHLCICQTCDLPARTTRCCPVCKYLNVRIRNI